MLMRVVSFAVLLGLLLCVEVQAVPTLELEPLGGAISGTPGSTIGWGFTITNDSDFLVVTSADFVPASSMGTFTDYVSAFNFIVVGPTPESSTVSQAFDPGLLTGIGSFTINPGAAIGSVANGTILLTYDLFSISPNNLNFNPDVDTLSVGNMLGANASVSVSGGTPIPEPSTLFLMGAGFIGVWMARKRAGNTLADSF